MSLDTKYRPTTYDDVVGQQATIRILREVVKSGKGFHQSYIFAGPHGSGKTTLGRILAQSLLCSEPQNGMACGHCISCSGFKSGSNPDFIEVDAATNSGKADMKEIVDQLQYQTFSGNRRLYLFDESHQLSKDALDAILKPLEDTLPASEDKKLVCIFCTTEPERMRQTIRSRCAPVFTIHKPSVDEIVERLRFVAEQEGISAEDQALRLIVEISESHMRDSLKALEGVSSTGAVDRDSVATYLHLDATDGILKVLKHIGQSEEDLLLSLADLNVRMPPSVLYEKLAEASLLVYRSAMKVAKLPEYWNADLAAEVASFQGKYLIQIANHLAGRPRKPTFPMLICDLVFLHHSRAGGMAPIISHVPVSVERVSGIPSSSNSISAPSVSTPNTELPSEDKIPLVVRTDSGVYMPPSAQKRETRGSVLGDPNHFNTGSLSKNLFLEALTSHTKRLKKRLGQSGQKDMGSP